MRLLLGEGDSMIGAAAQQGLRQEGYVVDWVRDGRHAELAIANGVYDLMLLDLGLPRRGGLEVLRSLRAADQSSPVMVITARDAVADRVLSATLGRGCECCCRSPLLGIEIRVENIPAGVRRASLVLSGSGEKQKLGFKSLQLTNECRLVKIGALSISGRVPIQQ